MSRRSRGTSSASRLLLFQLLLLAFTLVFCLVFAELAIRIVAPQPTSWLAIYREHPTLPFYALEPEARDQVETGETSWSVVTDAAGERVATGLAATTNASDCVDLWLGDSYAFGHGLDYEHAFVGLLAGRSAGRTRNAAVAGYGPVQYRMTLEHRLAEPLEIAGLWLATYVGNDFNDTLQDKDVVVSDGILGNDPGIKSFLKRNLHLYRLATAVYHQLATEAESPYARMLEELARPQAWRKGPLVQAAEIYERELAAIDRLARGAGVAPRVVVIPTREAVEQARLAAATPPATTTPPNAHDASRDALLPVAKAREILDRLQIAYVDLTPVLAARPTEETYFRFDGHLTEEGSHLAADAIDRRFGYGCARR